jgi:hypothetical protein
MIHATSFLDIVIGVRGATGAVKLGSTITRLKKEAKDLGRQKIDFKANKIEEFEKKTKAASDRIRELTKTISRLNFKKNFGSGQLQQLTESLKTHRSELERLKQSYLDVNREKLNYRKNISQEITGRRNALADASKKGLLDPNANQYAREWFGKKEKGDQFSRLDRWNAAEQMLHTKGANPIAKSLRAKGLAELNKLGTGYTDSLQKTLDSQLSARSKQSKGFQERKAAIQSEIKKMEEVIAKEQERTKELKKHINVYSSKVLQYQKERTEKKLWVADEKKATNDTIKAKAKQLEKEKRAAEDTRSAHEQAKADAEDMSRSWSSVAYFASKMYQHVAEGLKELKSFEIAKVFSMGAFSNVNPYTKTFLGSDLSEFGEAMKYISRSPFQKEFSSNIRALMSYSKIFGEDLQQVVPIVSGMQSMFGGGYSTKRILDTVFATSAQSGFNFSGWSSIMAQNAFPQFQTLEMELETVASLMSGLSNLGMGPFAAFGMNSILQLVSGGGSDKQKQLMTKLLGSTQALPNLIKEKGFYAGMEELNNAIMKIEDKNKRQKIMTELFSGMGAGVGSGLLQNLKLFKDAEITLSVPTTGQLQQVALQNKPVFLFEEMGAASKNVSTGLVDLITSMDSFKDQTKGLTSIFQDIGTALGKLKDSASKNGFGRATSFVAGTAIQGVSAYFMGKMLGSQMSGVYRYWQNATDRKINLGTEKMLQKLGTGIGILGAVLSVLSIIKGATENYFAQATERGITQRTLYATLLAKWKRGEVATDEERRAYLNRYGRDPSKKENRDWFDKIQEERINNVKKQISDNSKINKKSTLDVNVNVQGANIDSQTAKEMTRQIERSINESALGLM